MLNKFLLDSTAGIFTEALSDHQLYFLFMDISLKSMLPPQFVRVNLQNQVAMHNVKNLQNSEKIYNKLNTCPKTVPNLNYNIIHEEIMQPKKLV